MSSHGYPDYQRYAQWFGTPLVEQTGLAIGAGSHTDGPCNVNNWSSVIVYAKPTGGALTITVRQTSSGVPSSLVADTVIMVAAGSTRVQSVVLLGNSVELILQGSAGGETVDYALVPSNTAVNTGTVTDPTIGVQHNDVLIGSESAIDFEDASGFVWSIVDDPPGGRVKITPPALSILLATLYDNTLAGAAGGWDITNIPATYAHLLLIVQGKLTAGTLDSFQLQINGDTAAHYDWVENSGRGGATGPTGGTTGDTSATVARTALTTYGFGLWIPNYRNAAMGKAVFTIGGGAATGALNNLITSGYYAGWNNNAVIDRLKLSCGTTSAAGSRATLYGLGV